MSPKLIGLEIEFLIIGNSLYMYPFIQEVCIKLNRILCPIPACILFSIFTFKGES
jgi:hypothetical protein